MYKPVTFWGSIFSTFLFYTALTLGIPIANAQRSFVDLSTPYTSIFTKEVPCSTFLQPYFDWERGSSLQFVTASVVFNNAELVTYTTGRLNLNGNNLTGDFRQLLSNRFVRLGSLPEQGEFFDTRPFQPFSINEPASIGITLAADGSVTWVERSSNNATSNYRAVCYSNNTAILLPLFNNDSSAGVITFGKGTDPVPPR